jgi:hypothetical protein
MNAVVVYESVYGNTKAIAEAIAEAIADGLGGAVVLPVHEAAASAAKADLLIVGGPTHMHGMATSLSRRMAVQAGEEDGAATVEPGATAEPGLRRWLHELAHRDGVPAAAFDTRLDKSPVMTGTAARAIAKRLGRRGYEVVATESFLVKDAEGPLEDDELDRARAWGVELARRG